MAVNVGTLVIDLVAGTASFSAAMDKMSALSAKTANDISRSLTKISVAGVAAVTAVAGSLVAMGKSAIESVAALDRAAQSAGTTTETLSLLQYAAQTSGVETETLTASLVKLSKAELAAETGNVKLAQVFQKLGVQVTDGNKHLRDSGVVYEQLAVKFAAMQDGAVKTALALQLFGKAGASQIPLLNRLGTEIGEIRDEAQRLGLIIGSNTAEAAHQAESELTKLELTFKAVKLQIMTAVLPAVNELLTKLFEIAKNADIPALTKTFGETVSAAVTRFGEAMAFASKHVTALKVALEALVALQIAKILIPLAADLAAGGMAKLGTGIARFTLSLVGLKSVLPALSTLWASLAYGVRFLHLLAVEEGIATAATYAFESAVALLGGPIGVAIIALGAMGTALYALRDKQIELAGTTYKLADSWNAAWIAMKRVAGGESIATAWIGALEQAKAEREAAEKDLNKKREPFGPPKPRAGATEPDITGLAKPEKDPYEEIREKLQLAYDQQLAYISVLDATPEAIAKVTAAEKADAIILETNLKLKEKGKQLDADQRAEILRLVTLGETAKATEDFGKSLVTQRQQQDLATEAADALAAAQLRGVDAVRAAEVENTINALKLNKTSEELAAMVPLFDKLRASLLRGTERKPLDDLSTAIDQQKQKLDLETRQALIMADAWGKGDAAVAAARIQIELLGMTLGKGAAEIALLNAHTDELTAKLKALADAQALGQAQQNLKLLQDQAAEQKILAAAVFGTVDAQRQAEIAAKTYAIDQAIAEATDEKVIAALRAERAAIIANVQAQQQYKDATDALALRSPAEIYQRATEALQKQVDALKQANGGMLTYNEQLGIAAKQQELLNQALDDEINRLLKVGGLTDGVKAFFLEMQKSAISAAKIMYDALNSTIDKLTDNLSNLLTGQKANWSAMFKDIGKQMEQQSMKALLQKGLGALGSKLGIDLKGMQKRDGQSAETAWFMQLAGGGAPAMPGGNKSLLDGILPKLPGMNEDWGGGEGDSEEAGAAMGGGFSKVLGFFSKLAGAFGGGFAGGGEVEPGSAYLVGERGPELYSPGGTGSISTASDTRSLLTSGTHASVHYYNIDARGTDPVLTEQRTRAAIMAAHQSAILTSSQVQSEKTARTPPMPRR